jgi:hypothetical protein
VAEDAPQVEVLGRFLKDGKLIVMPAKAAKRRVVLALLRRAHPDTAALRRYLVDEGFMERAHGIYRRAGGTLEVD